MMSCPLAVLAVLLGLQVAAGAELETPVEVASLDHRRFSEWVEGAERPIGLSDASTRVLWTKETVPAWDGLRFGDSKKPGSRHLRIGFKAPISIGSVLVRGGGRLSVLKPLATDPGNPAVDEEWLLARRIVGGQVSGDEVGAEEYALWVLPPGTTTRALRFSHEALPADPSYAGWLGGAFVIAERFANIAPFAVATTSSREEAASKLNNGSNDRTWDAWDNGPEGCPRIVSQEHPEWLILTWPHPVPIGGLVALWAGFGCAEIQAYAGPTGRHPREAGETDWKPIRAFDAVESRYPLALGVNMMNLGRAVTAKAIRLRITKAARESHPHLVDKTKGGRRVWLGELMALQPLGDRDLTEALLAIPESPVAHPPIPVRFTLKEPGFVTLVIEDGHGKRVRNLVSETPFPAGSNFAWWDGMDDLLRDEDAARHGIYHIPARLVEPGTYRVRGLTRQPIELRYEFSAYNAGHPPWATPDHTGGWLANHTPPSSALFVPANKAPGGLPLIYLGSYVSEGGDGLAWVDLDGHKQGGVGWVGGNWTGAQFLALDVGPRAVDGTFAYAGSAWEGDLRLTALTTTGDRPVAPYKFAGGKEASVIAGLAVRDARIVCSLPKQGRLLFVDAATGSPLGTTPLDDPRGLAFDDRGRLLALSGRSLLRFTIPDDLPAHLLDAINRLDRRGWKATSAANLGRAVEALDGDQTTRWDTGTSQIPGQSFALDLGEARGFTRVTLDSGLGDDYPRSFELFASADAQNWGRPIAVVAGTRGRTVVEIPRITARHLKIVQTGRADNFWSLYEVDLDDGPSAEAPLARFPRPEFLIDRSLHNPQQIALDPRGNIYISDRGASHQVKVFSAEGKALRIIGHPGEPKAGPYDPEHMNNPNGLTIDSKDRLWVTETDFQPKRVSLWTLEGNLVDAFYGPAEYGGGGAIDPVDKTRFYYHGMELTMDWEKGTSRVAAILNRPGPGDLPLPEGFGVDGQPETALYRGGRRYFANAYNSNPTNGAPIALIWQDRDGIARPVAALGQARSWAVLNFTAAFSVRWTGKVSAATSGNYAFAIEADNPARLTIDGKEVVAAFEPHDRRRIDRGTARLEAGKRHDVVVEYRKTGSNNAVVKLSWTPPGQPESVIPSDRLHPEGVVDVTGGLTARYFSDSNFARPRLDRIDPQVDFDLLDGGSKGWPLPQGQVDGLEARLPPGTSPRDPLFFAWSDLDGDAHVQPVEVTFLNESSGGITVMPDLAFVASRVGGQARRFAPLSITAKGVPVYDVLGGETLVHGAQPPTSSGGDQVIVAPDGRVVLTVAPGPFAPQSLGGAFQEVANWSYPSPWPGLHASHESPVPDRPGQVIGTTRLLGGFVTPKGGDAGPVWGINGNMGNMYLFTSDGLFLATLFKDVRQGKPWTMPTARRGMLLNDLTLHDENFWPSMAQTADGGIYLVAGNPDLVRIDGLESVVRLPENLLRLSSDDLERARAYLSEGESRRQRERGTRTLAVSLRSVAPVVDGKLDDWAGVSWAEVDKRGVAANFNSDSKPYDVTAAVTVAGDRLFAAFRTGDPDLLRNSGETPSMLFKTGGALDLMIGTDPRADPNRRQPAPGDVRILVAIVKGKPMAMLYRAVVPGSKTPVPFSSPWRTILIDRVEDISGTAKLAGQAGNFELSVPLATFGLEPGPGQSIRADIGILRGDGFRTVHRVYWQNKATALTADIPSEAMLTPDLWGRWHFAPLVEESRKP
jgi:hypothetical protein